LQQALPAGGPEHLIRRKGRVNEERMKGNQPNDRTSWCRVWALTCRQKNKNSNTKNNDSDYW